MKTYGSKSSANIGTKGQTGGGKTMAGPAHGTSTKAGGNKHGHAGKK
jgi:hypothetical protein